MAASRLPSAAIMSWKKGMSSQIGVSTPPGAMALTRMPSGATSLAATLASWMTAAFDERGFLRAVEDKILAALGREGDRGALPRALIEQAYPRVRCRAFFGREISLEGRYGAYAMPFLDHRLVVDETRHIN